MLRVAASALLFAACAAPKPIEVIDDGAPRRRAVASATASAASPVETAPTPTVSAPAVPVPDSAAILDHEEPGLPADASELTKADAEFRAKRTSEAAALFINAFQAAKQSERTTGIKQSLDDAIGVELERLAEMEAGWLSQIGLDGYCMRTTELRQLPASAATRTKITAQAKRFCGKRARKDQ